MQTVLGAGGQIADELTRELARNFTDDIRLVSRNPKSVVGGEQLVAADLTDKAATVEAVAGSDVVYLTVGLPMDSALWEQKFPAMMANTLDAVHRANAKLVFFDNTYMYPRTAAVQTEDTAFAPVGRKSLVRARIADLVLAVMESGATEAVIGRAPEFYGPDRTQSLTNTAVFDRILAGKRPLVPLNAHTKRSLIWTPDASRALALLGNTEDAFGQTWHLPIDHHRQTYAELVAIASEVVGRNIAPITVPRWLFAAQGLVRPAAREAEELLPRYRVDNIFDSSKFAARFPEFPVTTYREGVTTLLARSST